MISINVVYYGKEKTRKKMIVTIAIDNPDDNPDDIKNSIYVDFPNSCHEGEKGLGLFVPERMTRAFINKKTLHYNIRVSRHIK